MTNPPLSSPSAQVSGNRRVRPLVALRLLEVIRDQDRPGDIMEAEDPAVTMPRRLGLSDVVERQIRTYREDVRKGSRLSDDEIKDLFRLVIRRPDGDEVFFKLGLTLASPERSSRWTRWMPRSVQYAVARTRVKRGLKNLFGRRVGGFGRGPFTIEGRSLLFIESDPGGEACHILSGYCREVLRRSGHGEASVRHTFCQGRGDDLCRWEGTLGDLPGGGGNTAPGAG